MHRCYFINFTWIMFCFKFAEKLVKVTFMYSMHLFVTFFSHDIVLLHIWKIQQLPSFHTWSKNQFICLPFLHVTFFSSYLLLPITKILPTFHVTFLSLTFLSVDLLHAIPYLLFFKILHFLCVYLFMYSLALKGAEFYYFPKVI